MAVGALIGFTHLGLQIVRDAPGAIVRVLTPPLPDAIAEIPRCFKLNELEMRRRWFKPSARTPPLFRLPLAQSEVQPGGQVKFTWSSIGIPLDVTLL